MKATLYLLRHGKTEATEKHIYCGWSDLPLSPLGIEEIKGYIGEGIYDFDPDLIITSGMKRANETAELIFPGREYTVETDLMEMNFGAFELRSYEELKTVPSYIAWIEDSEGTTPCENGEATGEFYNRCNTCMRRILSDLPFDGRDGMSLAIVSHGGTINGFISKYVDSSLKFYEAQPAPARGFKIDIELDDEGFKVKGYTRI